MTKDDCREVAARIWTDPAYSHMVMDVKLCEAIAEQLYELDTKQRRHDRHPLRVIRFLMEQVVPAGEHGLYKDLSSLMNRATNENNAVWRRLEQLIQDAPNDPWKERAVNIILNKEEVT